MPGDAVAALRRAGHDVAWVRTDAPGSTDVEVLARARNEERIVITFDKDFGELAYRAGLPPAAGVILLRFPPLSPSQVAQMVAAALGQRDDWAGHFSVIERRRIRMRPLPDIRDDEGQ